ncbi:hypothetical protein ISN45_At03g013780 [Arabidopsis thaliana x Arabidopsis arenosa]|uniref:Uncharacterized protein n=1 Tax=Arabidopsis thaliana x Arabidopsis arenosa TaxID=1240361 RepID=A0A8T2EMA4_9BRAS|nr:hypothetical protein ISN45_At03g013780 [Arabidopsis thaliana x Arabidopsis arenosa]
MINLIVYLYPNSVTITSIVEKEKKKKKCIVNVCDRRRLIAAVTALAAVEDVSRDGDRANVKGRSGPTIIKP